MNIVLLGAPGSGKGTVSNILVEKYHYFHVAPGDIFRKNIKEKTPLGMKVKSIISAGNLVSDELVSEITKDYIKNLNTTKNIIVDGFPRTITQAENLFVMFKELNIKIDYVIYLDIEKDVVLERLSKRTVCINCGKTYHSVTMPEKVLGVCDRCGGSVEKRKDDLPESINKRFENFQKQTVSLIDFYKNRNMLVTFKNILNIETLIKNVLELDEKNSKVPILTVKEIANITHSGKILAKVHKLVKSNAKAGVSLLELDKKAYELIISEDSKPAFLNYQGFPNSLCISVNDVLIHGIPTNYILQPGDVISVDGGVRYKNMFTDAAISFIVPGKENILGTKLIKAAQEALDESIKILKPGVDVQEIGQIIEMVANKYNFRLTKQYCGHGVGRKLHDEPMILNYFEPNYSFILKENMVIAIEPMILENTEETFIEKDGWSVKSINKCLSAHVEHTILITKNGSKIISKI